MASATKKPRLRWDQRGLARLEKLSRISNLKVSDIEECAIEMYETEPRLGEDVGMHEDVPELFEKLDRNEQLNWLRKIKSNPKFWGKADITLELASRPLLPLLFQQDPSDEYCRALEEIFDDKLASWLSDGVLDGMDDLGVKLNNAHDFRKLGRVLREHYHALASNP